ncbi:MAG: MBG domain-containing protein, partial [Mucilaginibacter sp.]
YNPGNITITQATLTITANNISKTYGTALTGGAGSNAFTSVGLQNGETVGTVTIAYGTGSAANASVAGSPYNSQITASAATGGTFNAGNYTLAYNKGNITITQATLTITANNISKTYGTALTGGAGSSAFTSVGLQNGETVGTVTIAYGTGSAANASVAGSPYNSQVTASAVTGGTFNAGNYSIGYNPGNITITQATLTITANNISKTYGTALTGGAGSSAFTSVGLQNGETIGTVTIAYGTGAAANASVAGSPYNSQVTASLATGGTFNAGNYTLAYNKGNITITQATLTITANNVSKAYGTALTGGAGSNAFTSVGLQNGETIGTVTIAYGTGSAANASVAGSPYNNQITASAATGGTFSAGNYTIGYNTGNIIVTQATLTITATGPTKTYGTALTAGASGVNFTVVGLAAGETVTSVTLTPNAAGLSATTAAGSAYTVTASAPSGGGGFNTNNYSIGYNVYNGTVAKATITITANNQSKTYGSANPTLTVAYSGFVNGETQAVINTLPTISTTAVTGSNVGTYPITATGANDNNYTFTYIAGTLTVNQAVLAVTANNQSKTYGSANPTLTVSYSGFVNGDTQAAINTLPTVTTTAVTGSNAGTYPITASAASDNNYTFTYTPGTLTINQAVLTVTAANQSKTYGAANPTLTVSYSGFVNGDTQAAINVLPTVSTTATVASNPGTYPITATGASDNNYTFSYFPGTLTIYPTTITGTGNSGCYSSTVTLSASGATPAGGTYNWYAAASGGASLQTGANYTTPVLLATTTYYVDYTQGGVTTTPRVAVTATVNSAPVLTTVPTSGAYFSYSFTGNANDVSGSGNNGTTQNGPTLTSDRYNASNSAYTFNGTNQSITTNTKFSNPQTFTISVWFKTTSNAGGYLVGFGDQQTGLSANYDRFIYMTSGGQLWFGMYPANTTHTISTTAAYNDGNWHHAVATFSTTNGSSLYVDGSLQASDANMNAGLNYTNGGYWRVGYDNLTNWQNQPSSFYFNGTLDDISVSTTEMTAAQVATLYGAGSSTYCVGNPLSLQVNTVAGATYAWSGPNSFSSSAQNPTVTASASATNLGVYTCTVTSATGCASTIKVTVPTSALTYTWSGATSTDPTVSGNWSYASGTNGINYTSFTTGTTDNAPRFDATTNLVIPNGMPRYPSFTANESIFGLTIASGASINLNGHTLSVGCNIVNSATTSGTTGILYGNSNASQITWNGSLTSQTYTGTSTTNTAQLGSMTVNNSAGGTVTINSGPLDIYYLLTMTKGNLTVGASPAALTLKSTAIQTANVAAVPATCTISGNVSAERYLSAHRGYRLIASPVYSSTVGSNNVYSLNYVKNAAWITGTSATGGFDKVSAGPTLYIYREDVPVSNSSFISGNYQSINNLNSGNNTPPTYTFDVTTGSYSIPVSNAFLFFFRGNKNAGTVAQETVTTWPATTATLTTTGTLTTGQVVFRDWYNAGSNILGFSNPNIAAQGFNLAANPYASSIDWETYNTTNPGTTGIYTQNLSKYVYELNPLTQNYDVYEAAQTPLGSVFTNHGTRTIESGQGFFVLALNTGPAQLIFNESAKVTTQNTGLNLMMGKPADQVANTQLLRLQLAKDSVNTDDILIRFNDNAKATFDINEDAPYRQGSGKVSISSFSSDNRTLAINQLPLLHQGQVIPLKVGASADGTYKLNMSEIKGISPFFDIWLKDNYLKDSVNMRVDSSYSFSILHSDTNSFGSRRFVLVTSQDQAYAYRLLDFNAKKVPTAREVQVMWKTAYEENYTNFTVERSTDNGKTFNVLGGVNAAGMGSYSFLDTKPIVGQNLYRLKQEDINNKITYSKVVPISYSDLSNNFTKNKISVFPNPVSSEINLAILTDINVNLTYDIMITNSAGFLIKQVISDQTSWKYNINDWLPGTYLVKVYNSVDHSEVGTTKFIKL